MRADQLDEHRHAPPSPRPTHPTFLTSPTFFEVIGQFYCTITSKSAQQQQEWLRPFRWVRRRARSTWESFVGSAMGTPLRWIRSQWRRFVATAFGGVVRTAAVWLRFVVRWVLLMALFLLCLALFVTVGFFLMLLVVVFKNLFPPLRRNV